MPAVLSIGFNSRLDDE